MNKTAIKISKWRKTSKLTSEKAALLLGISQALMSNYERGVRRIPAERVGRISEVTKIPPHVLRSDLFKAPIQEPAE